MPGGLPAVASSRQLSETGHFYGQSCASCCNHAMNELSKPHMPHSPPPPPPPLPLHTIGSLVLVFYHFHSSSGCCFIHCSISASNCNFRRYQRCKTFLLRLSQVQYVICRFEVVSMIISRDGQPSTISTGPMYCPSRW